MPTTGAEWLLTGSALGTNVFLKFEITDMTWNQRNKASHTQFSCVFAAVFTRCCMFRGTPSPLFCWQSISLYDILFAMFISQWSELLLFSFQKLRSKKQQQQQNYEKLICSKSSVKMSGRNRPVQCCAASNTPPVPTNQIKSNHPDASTLLKVPENPDVIRVTQKLPSFSGCSNSPGPPCILNWLHMLLWTDLSLIIELAISSNNKSETKGLVEEWSLSTGYASSLFLQVLIDLLPAFPEWRIPHSKIWIQDEQLGNSKGTQGVTQVYLG